MLGQIAHRLEDDVDNDHDIEGEDIDDAPRGITACFSLKRVRLSRERMIQVSRVRVTVVWSKDITRRAVLLTGHVVWAHYLIQECLGMSE